ncbi:ribonuclease H-like domain-containing protein, partial [Tanacetum coccineum]
IIKSSICSFKSESKLKRGFNFTSRWGNDPGDHIYPVRKTTPRTNKERDNRNNNKTEVCRNFGRGVCRWGATCRGLDLAAQQQLLSLLQAQNTLLAQYGLSTISIPRTPIGFNNSGQRIVPAQPSAQQLMTHGLTPNQQALFTNAVQNTGNTSSNTGQETVLPTAFNTMTLQDPVNANWHMDTGASSHLNSSAHNLSTIFNSRMYPSVLVGDGKSIPVTNTGHSTPKGVLHVHQLEVKMPFCMDRYLRLSTCINLLDYRDPRILDACFPFTTINFNGLKQAPRAWGFQRFAPMRLGLVFLSTVDEIALLILLQTGLHTAYLLLYVDDIVLTASSTALLQRIIASLHAEFSMTDLGTLNYLLGI